MERNVDVAINVMGKTAQTMLSLLSLVQHSGRHINRVFFVEERSEINYNLPHKQIRGIFGKHMTAFVPRHHLWRYPFEAGRLSDPDYRWSLRYQYAFEHSDRKYLLLIHNDVLFLGDVIGQLLSEINGYLGAGQIGMCNACPAFWAKECSSERYYDYRPTFEHLHRLFHLPADELRRLGIPPEQYEHRRKYLDGDTRYIQTHPWPLPDCRLNEWCCLIDMEQARPLTAPVGDAPPFGAYVDIGDPETGYGVLDIGAAWFAHLSRRGHRFKHLSMQGIFQHRIVGSGHHALFNEEKYVRDEDRAMALLEGKYLPRLKTILSMLDD